MGGLRDRLPSHDAGRSCCRLARAADGKVRWKLVWEFLEEYRWEPEDVQPSLLHDEPSPVGDERWDTLLAALAEHLAAQHDLARRIGLSSVCCSVHGSRRNWRSSGPTPWSGLPAQQPVQQPWTLRSTACRRQPISDATCRGSTSTATVRRS
jgi:hypothetical protein